MPEVICTIPSEWFKAASTEAFLNKWRGKIRYLKRANFSMHDVKEQKAILNLHTSYSYVQ